LREPFDFIITRTALNTGGENRKPMTSAISLSGTNCTLAQLYA
jgi:hypothetical protein